MRLLLDTHALIWFLADDRRLSRYANAVVSDPANEVEVSVASLWEITVKSSLGKLEVDEPFEDVMPARLETNQIAVLPIRIPHLAALRHLPFHHKDPFDRLIVAQALAEGVPLVTADRALGAYGVDVVWDEP
jgi:PIN domain nuclease of toxin-antitoxin system